MNSGSIGMAKFSLLELVHPKQGETFQPGHPTKGSFTYYVSTLRGEGGSKISQNMLIYSNKTAYKRGEGGQKSLKMCVRNI